MEQLLTEQLLMEQLLMEQLLMELKRQRLRLSSSPHLMTEFARFSGT